MNRILIKKNLVKLTLIFLTTIFPFYVAAEEIYSSKMVNKSKHSGSNGYKLIKTKTWPHSGCLIDTGKQIVFPGEIAILKVKKDEKCKESGVGYSIYKVEDKKNQHLLGYVSHRLGSGKFSVQISRFCEGEECVFSGLNPEQKK